MMSILLLTLWSKLHCHPGVMSRVSLLPVANVVESLVQKVVDAEDVVQLEPDLKSRVKVASVKLPLVVAIGVLGLMDSVVPSFATVNMSAQSCWSVVQRPTGVGQSMLTS